MAIKIALDAGHGLYTAGKETPDKIKEWTLNDKVRDYVVALLADYDCEIIHTDNDEGKTDETLNYRWNKYLKAGVSAFVSIHHNAYTGKWGNATGVGVYTDKNPTKKDIELANCIYKRLVKNTGLKGRGVQQYEFYVINQDRIPAVLVEGGFMDGRNDYKYITSEAGQKAYAQAVADGLIEFLNLKKKAATKPAATVKELYRVRASWQKAETQTGAFYDLDNAIAQANRSQQNVYSSKGKLVYSFKKSTAKKTVDEVAKEVIGGKWGNGTSRKEALEKAGYNYAEVQRKVNELLK